MESTPQHPLTIKCMNTTTDTDGSIYGKFVIEPLERGYGTTLGNSLRRVLLSGLSGCAITSVRIEGITHEYTTIPNVVEDVLDIMLNMKGVVLKSSSNNPETQYLRLDVDKPGPVFASDIETPADVKVINPDWHICTLSDGGSVHAVLSCETGKGYVAGGAGGSSKAAVDTLPIDAVFMPIRRVAFHVEDMRVGQRTDYDKLTLEIWSNGSIDVSSALSQSANQLIELLLPVASLSGIPTLVTQSGSELTRSDDTQTPNITIEDLELSVRAFNCLKRANINSIAELMLKSEHDLLNIKNFGKKSSDEVVERMRAFGLELKPSPVDIELEV